MPLGNRNCFLHSTSPVASKWILPIKKTAFTTHQGLYEFTMTPIMEHTRDFPVPHELYPSGLQCLVHLDNVIIFSKTFEEHLARLTVVWECLRSAGLKIRPSQCHLLQRTMSYLGHTISQNGIATDPKKILCLKHWPTPSTIEQLRSCLGLARYYHWFIGTLPRCQPLCDDYRRTPGLSETKSTIVPSTHWSRD